MKKKEKITLGVIALLLIVTIIGVSYAAFTFAQSGKNLNTMTTGIMQMSYEESSNIIKMTGALPTTDATGKVRLNEGEYFDFTVSSTIQGDAQINWEIAAEDFSSNTFDGKNVKLYLTSLDSSGNETEVMAPKVFTKKTTENKKTGRPANMMSLATGTMSASTSTKYRLRMYVDEKYNPQGDGGGKKFAVRINVYGKVYEEPTGSQMKAVVFSNSDSLTYKTNDSNLKNVVSVNDDAIYGKYVIGGGPSFFTIHVNDIKKIIIQDTLTIPNDVTYSEDVSEANDGSVMAYVTSDNTLIIAGQDGIIAGSYIKFRNFSQVTNLDLSNLDTSKVTDMNQMFQDCSSLTSLNLSNFDTSNVTDMGGMFDGCTGLNELDLTSFDTSKVINMKNMFDGCSSLTSLNLSNFDTSKVNDIERMFRDCTGLNELDLTSFDTSKVDYMDGMFYGCSKMQSIKVGSKWVIGSGCTTTDMFTNCGVSSVTYV